ncbi:MAG: META domain-containing protein [Gammaproteobacteria bacterium]|nr:META domain-containing protein [Gammaproteobacteria bacterium]
MIVRLAIGLLLLVTAACVAAPGQIEGFYRFGHEVNTVCTGDPELCYWLVDTSAEVRQQLKQQVENLAPYAPVCVRLAAEVSEQKADGFGLDYDGSIRVLEMLGRCDQASAPISTRLEDLQHRRWILHSIDGIELSAYAQELGFDDDAALVKVPNLDFGEQGFVSGNTGCNQFHGQARVIDDSLILSQLATTMMMCADFSAELELRLQLLYRNPLAITREGNTLILQDGEDRLRYEPRDWVQ